MERTVSGCIMCDEVKHTMKPNGRTIFAVHYTKLDGIDNTHLFVCKTLRKKEFTA